MNKATSLQRMTTAALIAALYATLTLVLPIASFGPLQLRFSEMLTILPVFTPAAIPGLTLGCAIANAIGVAMGANTAGIWDILVGSAATLIAALASYALRGVRVKGLPLLSTVPPVLVNAVLIGGQLSLVLFGTLDPAVLTLTMLQVGAGQVVPCIVGGLVLFRLLCRSGLNEKLFKNR